ncbi:MAG: CBS domain-containing protein [Armatimonadota bacterium]|nr:CBS domain-containing protein [Armatimonadota bacterium]MDR7485476.1 CBS domain-containing protein [Armatimonadota bacterium]MDR7533021.1 CBS domain-containing protein [Armatimonadota bacterium]MDR7536807.1 CBS domain-containing protein [Armatimonadota bacterium]
MLVRDSMIPDPRTIEPEATLADAIDLMRALRVRHLPVMSGRRLAGIVTWTDLMRAAPPVEASLAGRRLAALFQQTHVRDVMTKDPITVGPDVPVEAAARLLRDRKIGCLPVVERGMLVGIVTESDLFDALIHMLGGDLAGLRVSVELPAGLADLAGLAAALQQRVGAGEPVAINARIDATGRRAHVRVATQAPLVVAEHLAAAGYEVSTLRIDRPVKAARAHVG